MQDFITVFRVFVKKISFQADTGINETDLLILSEGGLGVFPLIL